MKDLDIEKQEIIKINKLIDNKYTVLFFKDGYQKSRTKCIIECEIHGLGKDFGTPWIPLLANLKNNNIGCPKCKNTYIETEKEVLERFKKEINPKYKVIGFTKKYTGKRTSCVVECDIHGNGSEWGNPWTPNVDTLLRGFGCPKCSKQYKPSEKEALENLKNILINNTISILGFKLNYKGKETKCIVKCDIHGNGCDWGNPWTPTISNLKRGISCPKCSLHYVNTEKEAYKELKGLFYKKSIKFLNFNEKYKGYRTRCSIECLVHGCGEKWENPWIPIINDLKTGYSCPKCAIERNELSNCLKHPKQFKYGRILYFVTFKNLIDNKLFYKIGITTENRCVEGRFTKNNLKKDNIEIIKSEEVITTNINALLAEYWSLRKFDQHKKYMLHILKESKGGTECFSKNITEIMSLEDIIKNSSNDFKSILKDFDLTDQEKKNALIEFKKVNK